MSCFPKRTSSPLACLVFLLFLPTCRMAAQTTPSDTGNEDSTSYVGVEVCQGCHEDLSKIFAKSAHAATLKNKSVSLRGCEGCHGPGAEHVEAGGDPGKIWRYAGAKRETVIERCTRCHETELRHAHTPANLGCFTCHSIHHATQRNGLLIKPPMQLCRSCHHQK